MLGRADGINPYRPRQADNPSICPKSTQFAIFAEFPSHLELRKRPENGNMISVGRPTPAASTTHLARVVGPFGVAVG
jgi:hypothetical protein